MLSYVSTIVASSANLKRSSVKSFCALFKSLKYVMMQDGITDGWSTRCKISMQIDNCNISPYHFVLGHLEGSSTQGEIIGNDFGVGYLRRRIKKKMNELEQ